MRYKAEVMINRKIYREFYFKDKSHPNQVVRSVTSALKRELDYFIVLVMNEIGEIWRFVVMKQPDRKFHIRKMDKSYDLLTRNDVDLVFTGNKKIGMG
jgi:hypothetical protein